MSPTRPPQEFPPPPRILEDVSVLVVGDGPDTRRILRPTLAAAGAEVLTVPSSPEALRLLASRSVSVVVTDIGPPRGDGYYLLSRMLSHADPGLKKIPVIAVAGPGNQIDRAHAISAGFTAYLSRPVDPAALCWAVAKPLGRGSCPAAGESSSSTAT